MTSDPNIEIETGDYVMPRCSVGPPPGYTCVRVDLGALSHPGKVRPNNEDVYIVSRLDRSLTRLLTNLPEGVVPERVEEVGYGLLVADGMGGMAAGEVASRLAVSTLHELVLHRPDWIMRIDAQEGARLADRITQRFREVDAALKDEARAHPELEGMGTTLTLAFNLGADLFVGHAGDSRAYLCRGEQLLLLTRDHTRAQQLADEGKIPQEEVRTHRLRNILIRALGGGNTPVEPDVQQIQLDDGDQLLLCTDGLSDLVDEDHIAAALRSAATADGACRALVDLALDAGGRDNITVAIARYRFDQAR
jgi:protein phosphatase